MMKKALSVVFLSIILGGITYSFDIGKIHEITSNTPGYNITEIDEIGPFNFLFLKSSEEKFLELKGNLGRTVSVGMYQLDNNHGINDIDEVLENVTMESSYSLLDYRSKLNFQLG